MSPINDSLCPSRKPHANGWMLIACLMLLAAYAFGLTRNVAQPWVGMHDWNGAFFSQLARNMLRYPWEIHHGMPVVAVGEQVPPPEERSIYATHPPGLVWLVAASFSLFGESEWAARVVPIVTSLISLLLLMSLVNRRYGREAALLAGLVYAVMPLSVFYGRMVDHEAVCLAGMLAVMKCRQLLDDAATWKPIRRLLRVGMIAALAFIVWIDWSGLLFAVLFCANAIIQWRGKRRVDAAAWRGVLVPCAATVAGTASMLVYLVYAGLGGRWGDLLAIFTSRAGRVEECRLPSIWRNTLDNFTWPVLVFAVVGLLVVIADQLLRRHGADVPNQPDAPARVGEREDQPDAPAGDGASGSDRDPSPERERREDSPCAADPVACASGSDRAGHALSSTYSLRRPVPTALPVLAVTGLVWLAAFPRQYQIHGYWAFYLGPVAAVLAAIALHAIHKRLARVNRVLGWAVPAVGCLAIIATGLNGAARFYRVRWFAEDVESYRAIHGLTSSGDRLVLFEDPIRPEQHGGYRFRNITPPHLAYYLDRAFDVDQDFARIAAHASGYAGLIIPLEKAEAHQTELRQFFGSFLVEPVGSKLYVRFVPPLPSASAQAG